MSRDYFLLFFGALILWIATASYVTWKRGRK